MREMFLLFAAGLAPMAVSAIVGGAIVYGLSDRADRDDAPVWMPGKAAIFTWIAIAFLIGWGLCPFDRRYFGGIAVAVTVVLCLYYRWLSAQSEESMGIWIPSLVSLSAALCVSMFTEIIRAGMSRSSM